MESILKSCHIQNPVITNSVIKRYVCAVAITRILCTILGSAWQRLLLLQINLNPTDEAQILTSICAISSCPESRACQSGQLPWESTTFISTPLSHNISTTIGICLCIACCSGVWLSIVLKTGKKMFFGILRRMSISEDFLPTFLKRETSFVTSYWLSWTPNPFKKKSSLKGKNFLPMEQILSF